MSSRFLCEFKPVHAVFVSFLQIWDHGSLFKRDVVCGPACLAYLVYNHSTPSPLCLCDSWKSTRVGSCHPGCGSSCALLFLFPGSAPWSRPLRSSSCTGCRSRWRLSLHGRNRLFRGSGRSRWTAGWMKGRCWNNRNDHPQPKVRLRGRQKADSCYASDSRQKTTALIVNWADFPSASSPSRGTRVRNERGKTMWINETPHGQAVPLATIQ